MNWAAVHFWSAIMVLAYTLIDARPKVGRQHTLGAEILLGTWVASWAARNVLSDTSPLEAYVSIDMMAIIVFSVLMTRRRALWAALCVIFHVAMLVLHFAFYLTGQINQGLYLWTLGVLFSASVLTVILATAAGRHEWGVRLDNFIMARFGRWSWSGLIRSRIQDYKAKVA